MKCCPAAKLCDFQSDVPHRWRCRDDEFDNNDAVYRDNVDDYADLPHRVQVVKNYLRLIHMSMILVHYGLNC